MSALELPHCDVDSAAALVPWQQSSYDERMAQTIEKTVYLLVSFSTVLDSFIDICIELHIYIYIQYHTIYIVSYTLALMSVESTFC